jgi:hypothetical protein
MAVAFQKYFFIQNGNAAIIICGLSRIKGQNSHVANTGRQ